MKRLGEMTATHIHLVMTRSIKHDRSLVKTVNMLLGSKRHKRDTYRGRLWVSAPPLQVKFFMRIDHPMSRENTTPPKLIGDPKPRHNFILSLNLYTV